MPELSEFVEFVMTKSGMCYFGYYRFSVDLDFTWKNQEVWRNLGKKRLRRELLKETERFAMLLEQVAVSINLDFKNDVRDMNYIEFGSGNRMVTFKLWKNSELIKVRVNFVEKLISDHEIVSAKTLIDNIRISEEGAYVGDFLKFYNPLNLLAYSKEEILYEKARAILTRQNQKLHDFYDIFMLEKHGAGTEIFKEEVIDKTKDVLRYKKYRVNLERNVHGLERNVHGLSVNISHSKERCSLLTLLKNFINSLKRF